MLCNFVPRHEDSIHSVGHAHFARMLNETRRRELHSARSNDWCQQSNGMGIRQQPKRTDQPDRFQRRDENFRALLSTSRACQTQAIPEVANGLRDGEGSP